MKNEKKQLEAPWRVAISRAMGAAKGGVKRYARPALSGFLALTMVVGSVPAPAYAEMMDEAARSIALMAQDDEDAPAAAERADDKGASTVQDTSEQAGADDPGERAAADEPSVSAPAADAAADVAADEAPAALFSASDDLKAVTVGGDALASRAAAVDSLKAVGVSAKDAEEAAASVDAAMDTLLAPAAGNRATAEGIVLEWLSEGDVPSGDASQLVFKPSDDDAVSMRLRLTYAIMGEREHQPGEVTIVVPANMFVDRAGKPEGGMALAVPAEPVETAGWNYRLVMNGSVAEYHIVNTKRLNAATQGFIDFEIKDVEPITQVDMKPSAPFGVKLQVVESDGSESAFTSNELTAVFDTHATLKYATKGASDNPYYVDAADERVAIAHAAFPKAEGFVVVPWYLSARIDANQPFGLTFNDQLAGTLEGVILHENATDNGRAVEFNQGDGLLSFQVGTVRLESAYPVEQFEENGEYVFKNKVTAAIRESDESQDGTPKPEQTDDCLAERRWTFHKPQFVDPKDLFEQVHIGNDNKVYSGDSYITHGRGSGSPYGDLDALDYSYDGYYGLYGRGLNELRAGRDLEISYTFGMDARVLPWTYEASGGAVEGNPLGVLDNYSKKPVTVAVEEQELRFGDKALVAGEDFDYASVALPRMPRVYRAKAINLKPDGTVDFSQRKDGTVSYEIDDVAAHIPTVGIEVKTKGDAAWRPYAVANWTSGKLEVSFADGGTQSDAVVALPAQTVGVRFASTSKAAALSFMGRVGVRLKADGALKQLVEDAFAKSENPSLELEALASMAVSNADGASVYSDSAWATDRLMGFVDDMRASMRTGVKRFTAEDVDKANNRVKVTFTAQVHKRSVVEDEDIYKEALESGELSAERSGVWYDLLPAGMTPVLDSVKLRWDDSIRSVNAIEDFRGTGRTLLVVEADLTPFAQPYQAEWGQTKTTYYEDVPRITFDAWYGSGDIADFGRDFHNIAMYRSANEEIGTVDGYRGEADDPRGTQNKGTAGAFTGEDESVLDALTDIDGVQPEHNSMLYAGANGEVDPLEHGNVGLTKAVSVNAEDTWGTGNNGDKARNVYGGGTYTYRLSTTTSDTMTMKGIVLYDALESYKPGEDADAADKEAPRWRGTFKSIDVSQIERLGAKPEVYYSTVRSQDGWGPELSQGDGAIVENIDQTDLGNTAVWTKTTPAALNAMTPAERERISAIAVDATKKADGSEFVLKGGATLSAFIRMEGPSIEEADALIASGARALNCVHMASQEKIASEKEWSERRFVREGYTTVGVKPYILSVSKTWEDDGDRDGIRPTEVGMQLVANGEDVAGQRVMLNEANGWTASFSTLPYVDEQGKTIMYTVREEPVVAGYRASVAFDGETFAVTNEHEPERTTISGHKVWSGDNEDVRPRSIEVELLANGKRVGTRTVRGNDWAYSFKNLPVNEGGQPIDYQIREVAIGNDAYITSVEGTDVVNTYHPYGDLVISKNLKNEESLVSDPDFTFKATFERDGEPVFDELSYEVTGRGIDPAAPRTGTIATDGTFTLKAGQTARIKDVPAGVSYTVREIELPAGYSAVGSSTATGTISANTDNERNFVNEYEARATVQLGATKRLVGKAMKNRDFVFELRDETGALVRTAASGRPGEPVRDDAGNVVTEASVRFGALQFDESDSGTTFVYQMTEADGAMPGMQYSDAVYTVRITPHDQGDGTMTTDVVIEDAEGVELTADQKPLFENVYVATGEVAIQAFKKLKGGNLADGQFAFDLDEVVTAEDGSTSLVSVQRGVTNNAKGAVAFAPIAFDQTAIDSTHLYAIHEVDAGDTSIEYDVHYALVQVSVVDQGDGTLGFDMAFDGLSCPCFVCGGDGSLEDGAACAACDKGEITSNADDLTFVNSWRPAGLDIQKTWAEGSGTADPKHKFEFELELTNERGEPVEGLDFEGAQIVPVANAQGDDAAAGGAAPAVAVAAGKDDAQAVDAPADNPIKAFGTWALDALGLLFAPQEAHAAEPREIITGDEGDWHWSLDTETGVLTIGGTGIRPSRWYNNVINAARSVVFEPGSVAVTLGGSYGGLFYKLGNVTSIDFTNLDTSQVRSTESLFEGCVELTTINWASFDTSNVTSMVEMFYRCRALKTLDLSKLNTSKVTNMNRMFADCWELAELDITGFDMTKVGNVTNMFYSCKALTAIDLSPLASMAATDVTGLLSGCASLQAVDLSPLSGIALTGVRSLFAGCSGLKTIDVSQLNTKNVKSMDSLFAGCKSLESLDLSPLDTSNVTSMSNMFGGCTGTAPIDLSPLDTSKVVDMGSMFSRANLDIFNVSALDFSSVTDVDRMFSGATKTGTFVLKMDAPKLVEGREMFRETNLTSVDLTLNAASLDSLWMMCCDSPNLEYVKLQGDVPKLRTINQLFRGCPNLKTIDLSQLRATSLVDMASMARGCESLTQVDLGGITSDKLEDLDMAFQGCKKLASIDLSRFNTVSVLSMDRMFQDCASFTAVDFSHSSMPKISSFDYTFSGCTALTSVVFPEKMDGGGRKISGFIETFKNCTSLKEIDLSFLGHVAPRYFDDPIEGCTSLQKIDVSSIDTSNVYIGNFGYIQNSQLYSITLSEHFNFRKPEWINIPDDPSDRGTMWIRVDEGGNPVGQSLSTDALEEKYPGCGVGTYQWDTFRTIKFELNGASGSAPDRKVNISGDIEFTVPEAVYPDHRLVGWTYKNTMIPVGRDGVAHLSKEEAQKLFGRNKSITLVAQWQEVFEITEPSRGVYRFKVPAGHVLHLPDVIPSGTSYTVRELDEAGYKLVESSGTTGMVSAAAGNKPAAAFVNAELNPGEAPSARAEVRVTKMLDGAAASAADAFQFEMAGYDPAANADNGSWTAAVADGGQVLFPALAFDAGDLAGEASKQFVYTVREVAGGNDAIAYDNATITATVTVTQGAGGVLSTSIAYAKDDQQVEKPVFNNATKPATLSISKAVEVAAAPEAPFSFRVLVNGMPYEGAYSVDGVVEQAAKGVVKVAGGKTAVVEGLPADGTYAVEEIDLPAGWKLTGDAANKAGQLVAGATAELRFTNTYGFTAAGAAQLVAHKSFAGGRLADGMFSFDLYKGASVADGVLVGSAVNGPVDVADQVMGPDGTPVANPYKGMAPVYFGEQLYTAPGTHEYTLVERVPADAVNAEGVRYADATAEQRAAGGFVLSGVVYDSTEHHATVTVSDNGDGTLACDVAYAAGAGAALGAEPVFKNTPQRVGLELIKKVATELPEGSPARDAVFTFDIQLKDASGAPLRDQVYRIIAADGTQSEPMLVSDGGAIELRAGERALWTELPFGASYSIAERPMAGWVIDESASSGDLAGALTTVEKTASVTVASIYRAEGTVPARATKKFDGALVDDQFVFDIIEVRAGGERKVVATARNKADGSIDFGELTYVLEDVGHRYTYEVIERDLGEEGVVYDDTVYNLEVVPQDNGDGTLTCHCTIMRNGKRVDRIVFTNSRTFDLPFTGGAGVQLVGPAVLALGCMLYLVDRRRRAR